MTRTVRFLILITLAVLDLCAYQLPADSDPLGLATLKDFSARRVVEQQSPTLRVMTTVSGPFQAKRWSWPT